MINKLIQTILILFLSLNISLANTKNNKKQPIKITSNEVEITRDKSEIVFIKNVKAVHDKFTLYSDKMIVKYKEDNNKKIKIDNIQTDKNVKFINENVVATGNKGFYDVGKNIVILKNNVKATENGITVLAEEFEYNVLTGKTKIIGNKKQNEKVTIILENVDNVKK